MINMSNESHTHSPLVIEWAENMGHTIKNARRRRNLTQRQLAQQSNISLPTLVRLEKGDAGVALGKILEVMSVLDPEWVTQLLDNMTSDALGTQLTNASLPQRVRTTKNDF